MIKEGNSSSDPYTKFRSAGKLAKTVAHWKTKGIDVAVSRNVLLAQETQLYKSFSLLVAKSLHTVQCSKVIFCQSSSQDLWSACFFALFDRQTPRESSTMRGSRTKEKW